MAEVFTEKEWASLLDWEKSVFRSVGWFPGFVRVAYRDIESEDEAEEILSEHVEAAKEWAHLAMNGM